MRVDVEPDAKTGVPSTGMIFIEPVVEALPQPPDKVTVYRNNPDTAGVPLIVTTFASQVPVTPVGKPVTVAPVAPFVL